MVGPKISKASVAAAIVLVALQAPASAGIINVPGDQPSIQAGIDAANPGDEVVVAPGTYFENINFNGKAITVRSTDPTDPAVVANTIIDGGGSGSVVTCDSSEGSDTVLSGFFITNGLANYGGGMRNQGTSPTVTYCTFDGNVAIENGGGMDNDNSSPMVSHCTFSQNAADDSGGGMHNFNGAPTVTGCTFTGNTSAWDGGGMANYASSPIVNNSDFNGNVANFSGGGMSIRGPSSPMVIGCRFSGNVATNYNGGGMLCATASSPTVSGCTFSQNTANFEGGGIACFDSDTNVNVTNCTITDNASNIAGGLGSYESTTTVANCIFWDNAPGQIAHSGSGSTTVSYSDVQGGYSGTGNIDRDPLFVDEIGGDLRLLNCSPVADAGINSGVPGGVTTDLDGNPRFVDDAGISDTGSGDPPLVDMGAYERQVDSPVGLFNVPADFATIQAAIDAVCDGSEVVVAPGTYLEKINFNGKAITLTSTDPTDPAVVAGTIINGGGGGSVVTCNSGEGPDTILEGFTITGGYAAQGGGMYNDGSSPTVNYCTFIGNTAERNFPVGGMGGGMYNHDSSPTVTRCKFIENWAIGYVPDWWPGHAGFGGGMYNEASSPTVTNCTFSDNTALGYDGGCWGCPYYPGGSGMYNTGSSPTVTDSNICGNWIDQIDGSYSDGGGNFIAYCCADLSTDGVIDAADLAHVLGYWGPCGENCTPSDLQCNHNTGASCNVVDAADLAVLLGAWGPCEER